MTDTPTQRTVPGAPPPIVQSKSQQKKKRKGGASAGAKPASDAGTVTPALIPDAAAAALVDKAPDEAAIKDGAVSAELVVEAETVPTSAIEQKRSPVYDLVHKRQRLLGKKIVSARFFQHVAS